jgi:hypothetical protein
MVFNENLPKRDDMDIIRNEGELSKPASQREDNKALPSSDDSCPELNTFDGSEVNGMPEKPEL